MDKEDIQLCECGCGKEVKPGNKYILGHNIREKMKLHFSYDEAFIELINQIRKKYPSELFDLDGIGNQTDLALFSKKFFESKITSDMSVDANSNVDDFSVIAYTTELPKPFFRFNSYYMLWKQVANTLSIEKANEIIEMNISGDIYINDFHGLGAGIPYCFNYSAMDIACQGLPMVKKIASLAPKYLMAFIAQIEQFVTIASNSTLGATGFADLFIVMAWYVEQILNACKNYTEEFEILLDSRESKKSKLSKYDDIVSETTMESGFGFRTEKEVWRYVQEKLISLIYTINQPMRGNQSPFTNVSIFDDNFLTKLCSEYRFLDGTYPNKEIVKKIQTIFIDSMNIELSRTPITFPIVTACFSVDDNRNVLDEEFLKFIAQKNLKYGFINLYLGKTSTISSCCRLRSDIKEVYFNLFGSGSTKIGSLGVCTINLPRLAFRFKNDEKGFLKELENLVKVTGIINNTKRNIVKKRVVNGNHPLYSLGFIDMNSQYSTTGLTGINEALEIFGYEITTKEGMEFCKLFLGKINTTINKMQGWYKSPHNVEQIPAENTGIKLAEKDQLLGFNNGEYQIYSNQFIPLTTKANMLDRIKLQGEFDKYFSGGSILHVNIGNRLTDPKVVEDLIKACAKAGVIYWAINYNLQLCKNNHMSVGTKEVCNVCGEEIIDNFTRVVGFLTNSKNWSKVRREVDYPNRQWY